MRDALHTAVYVPEDLQLYVIGWVGVFISTSVVEDKHAETSGLIVDQMTRSHGVGAELPSSAEEWARANECQNLFVQTSSGSGRISSTSETTIRLRNLKRSSSSCLISAATHRECRIVPTFTRSH